MASEMCHAGAPPGQRREVTHPKAGKCAPTTPSTKPDASAISPTLTGTPCGRGMFFSPSTSKHRAACIASFPPIAHSNRVDSPTPYIIIIHSSPRSFLTSLHIPNHRKIDAMSRGSDGGGPKTDHVHVSQAPLSVPIPLLPPSPPSAAHGTQRALFHV